MNLKDKVINELQHCYIFTVADAQMNIMSKQLESITF